MSEEERGARSVAVPDGREWHRLALVGETDSCFNDDDMKQFVDPMDRAIDPIRGNR